MPAKKQMERYARLQSEFEALNGYQYEVELKKRIFHFGFEEDDLYKTFRRIQFRTKEHELR